MIFDRLGDAALCQLCRAVDRVADLPPAKDDGEPWMFLGIALFGLGIGNALALPPLIAQQEFASDETSRIVPLIVAIGSGQICLCAGSIQSAAWGRGS